MKKVFVVLFILLTSYFINLSPALADDEIRNLQLDLKAKGFTQSQWYDNLDSSNIIFAPNDKFQVQLVIKNLGNRNQTNIKINQTLPETVSTNSPLSFTISQIAAGQDYIRNITVTVKDKSYVKKVLTSDSTSFYTSNGTMGVATSSSTPLPNTGSASTLIFGSLIASGLALAGFKLRSLARGY